MTATDELRALLDERGVEWRKTPHYSSESQDNETVFEGNGIEWYANDHLNGRLGLRAVRYEVTPEQAVAATLGPGTCHTTEVVRCSDCEHSYIYDMTAMYPDGSRNARYCGRWSYLMQMVDDSEFCSFGVRREDE